MLYLLKYPVIIFILVILPIMLFAEEGNKTEQEKIQYLLEKVEESGAVFIRNGSEYSSKEAKEHLELKLKKGAKYAKTAEDFIENLASRSSFSGKPYKMKFPDGTEVKSGDWLHNQLSGFDHN